MSVKIKTKQKPKQGVTYAAVLAICPKSPGPWGAACCGCGGAAMVLAGRCCCGAGRDAGTVGRVGAREGTGARPADLLRGMVCDGLVFWWCWGREVQGLKGSLENAWFVGPMGVGGLPLVGRPFLCRRAGKKRANMSGG